MRQEGEEGIPEYDEVFKDDSDEEEEDEDDGKRLCCRNY